MTRQVGTMITIVAIAVTLTATLTLHGQGSGAKATAIAVVDVQDVFNNLAEKAAIEADITAMTESLQREEQRRKQDILAKEEDLKLTGEGTKAHEEAKADLEMMVITFEAWKQFQSRKLEREKAIRIEGLYLKTIDAIGKVAQRNGYGVVLYKEDLSKLPGGNQTQLAASIQVRKVLYHDAQLDITAQVTQLLNNEFNNRKAGE